MQLHSYLTWTGRYSAVFLESLISQFDLIDGYPWVALLTLLMTLAAIHARVLERGAASCKVAVLTDKVKPGPKPIRPDFVGLRIPDKFVFGCGLDAYGSWRNLPAIYALRQP